MFSGTGISLLLRRIFERFPSRVRTAGEGDREVKKRKEKTDGTERKERILLCAGVRKDGRCLPETKRESATGALSIIMGTGASAGGAGQGWGKIRKGRREGLGCNLCMEAVSPVNGRQWEAWDGGGVRCCGWAC